jgi:arginine exporter protein ArgO
VETFWSGVLAGYGIAVPVGAIGAYLVALTARTSFGVGASAALGVASADGLYALLAVLGGAALADAVSSVATPLRWTSFVVLVLLAAWMGIVGVREYLSPPPPRNGRRLVQGRWRAYVVLLGATVLNPATIVYFAALVIGAEAGTDLSTGERAAFVAGAFLASASWQLTLAGGGSALGRVLTGASGRLMTALASAALIAALAVWMLLG